MTDLCGWRVLDLGFALVGESASSASLTNSGRTKQLQPSIVAKPVLRL